MKCDFFDGRSAIQDIIGSSNSIQNKVEAIKPYADDADLRRELFSILADPAWIEPLYTEGYFSAPPQLIETEGGRSQHPIWPESQYLVRMALRAPVIVSNILSTLETRNYFVIQDIVKASLEMPANNAAVLVPTICKFSEEGLLGALLGKASDLCQNLIDGGEIEFAFQLAGALFTPKLDSAGLQSSNRDDHWYKKGLAQVAPSLAVANAQYFLPILCSWLETAVISKTYVDKDSGADSSTSWRPAIEEHEQNRDYDFAGVMVGIVRTAFEDATRNKAISPTDALVILDGQRFDVFARIRIHLINEFADHLSELARETMLDHSIFDDYKHKHEYAMLIGHRWDMLEPAEQDTWYRWIDTGPDMSSYDESIKRNLDREATEGDRRSRIRWWQFEKLHWIREHLSGERLEFYEQMKLDHGEPRLADLNSYSGRAEWGNKTPIALDELLPADFNSVLERISHWKPDTPDTTKGTVEGLASTFRKYIETNRVEFSKKASEVKGRPPIFARAFLSEMTAAVKSCEPIDLMSVLELCGWIVEQPLNSSPPVEAGGGHLVDNRWQWARDEVSEITEAICKTKVDERVAYTPSDDIRYAVWMLIDKLSRDTPDSYIVTDITEDDPRVYDYTDLGINSPRGKAMESALEYARWIANEVKQVTEGHEIIPGGFETMPEVCKLLEWQIAPDNRSYAAMSILGSRMGLLNWIDSDWLQGIADDLFSLEGVKQSPIAAEGWAAWNAFLVWVRPHFEFYERFKMQFAYAVSQASEVQLMEGGREQPMLHLGEHLVLLHGRGELALDDDGGILRTFIQSANPAIRRHAFGFIGRSLSGDEELPSEIINRFRDLWDLYWSGPGRQDAEERPDSLLFGAWFTCGRFDHKWLLERMLDFAEIAPNVEPSHSVAERLGEIAHTDIMSATKILSFMVYGDKEGWRISGWTEDAETILKLAMKADDDTRNKAEQIIDHLGRRGYIDFGKLLNKS